MTRWLAALGLGIALACATPSAPPLREATTVLVTRISADEELLLAAIRLRHVESGRDVALLPSGRPHVLSVEPGSYYLRRVDTHYSNLSSVRLPQPRQPFRVQPGAINYLGDLRLDLSTGANRRLEVRFEPREGTLSEARDAHPELFGRLPVLLIRPGVEPLPVAP